MIALELSDLRIIYVCADVRVRSNVYVNPYVYTRAPR